LVVNIAASAVLGFVTGATVAGGTSHVDHRVVGLVGAGLCGALSTYSAFAFETLRLVEIGQRRLALANVAVSVSVGLGAAFLGGAFADVIWG
jgi:CrcB protein